MVPYPPPKRKRTATITMVKMKVFTGFKPARPEKIKKRKKAPVAPVSKALNVAKAVGGAAKATLLPSDGSYEKPYPDPCKGKRTKDKWYTDIKDRGFEDGAPRKWRATPSQEAKGRGCWSCQCGIFKNMCKIHKGDLVRFEKRIATALPIPTPQRPLAFSDYEEDAMASLHRFVFEYERRESPLWGRSTAVRGALAERVVRRFDELVLENKTADATAGTCCNGGMRGKGFESYDYARVTSDGTRVRIEAKNARAVWATTKNYWVVRWAHVKADAHDVLLLALETPTGYLIYERGPPGTVGDCGQGVVEDATGKSVTVVAAKYEEDFDSAIAYMHDKLINRGDKFRGKVDFSDAVYADALDHTTVTEAVYEDVPLSQLSGCARGGLLEGLSRRILPLVLGCTVTDADITACVDGVTRGRNRTSSDYKMDGDATEHKSMQMYYNKARNNFTAISYSVKPDKHARRILSLYTPRGIHLFDHTGSTDGFTKQGVKEESGGKDIAVYAPVGMRDPVAAEEFLIKRLVHHWKLPYLAFAAF